MAKYIDAEKLKAEITRIYNEHPVYISERYEDGVDDGYHGCCDEIVAIIDSLQQEQISLPDNLDEAEFEYAQSLDENPANQEEDKMIYDAFKAGAKWMAERIEEEKKKHFKNALSNMGVED